MTSLALEGLKNNIGNYKGVMLCTRPNESMGQVKDKPFISRVDPKDQMGLNPVRRLKVRTIRRKANPILQRHRQWLEHFKIKIKEKKEEEHMKERDEQEKFERIKGNAMGVRTKNKDAKEEYETLSKPVNTGDKEIPQKTEKKVEVNGDAISPQKETKALKPSLKKKDHKPKWAMTEQQLQEEESKELDDLLDFTNQLDYEKYIHDFEVRNMISALKNRIDELQNEDQDWKKKMVDAWNNEDGDAKEDFKVSLKPKVVDIGADDNRSECRSVNSEAKSVASERSQKSIQDLKAKMAAKEKKDWDALSTTSKNQGVTMEDRLAKHVADEILRNNTQIRGVHSNASIRKLLEKEAKNHLEQMRGINQPKIVENKDYTLRKEYDDPNTLPYLHRNPAI